MRQMLVVGNWKMNGDRALVESLLSTLNSRLGDSSSVVVCPPVIYLEQANKLLGSASRIAMGAQDANQNASGAFTGEISLSMLKEFNCTHVIVGHSERRALYGDTNALVAEKSQAVLQAGLTPILCVGETEDQRDSGETERVVLSQLGAVVDQVGVEAFNDIIVAYEPVWAVGTGNTATPEQAQEVHALIRQYIAARSEEVASSLIILYGGSVKAENAAELFTMPDIDGGLVGGASLDSEQFINICSAAG